MNQRIKEILNDLKIFRGYKIADDKVFCERVAKRLGNLPEASSLCGEYDEQIEDAIVEEYNIMNKNKIVPEINGSIKPVVSSDDDIFKIFGTARPTNSNNNVNSERVVNSAVDLPIIHTDKKTTDIKDNHDSDNKDNKSNPEKKNNVPVVSRNIKEYKNNKRQADSVDLEDTTERVFNILNSMRLLGEKIILENEEYFCERVAKIILDSVDDIDLIECGEYDKNIENVIRSEYQGLIHGKWKFKEKEPLVKMDIDIEKIDGTNDMRLYVRQYLYKLIEVLGYSYNNQSDVVEKIVNTIEPNHYILIVNGKYEDYMKTLIISGSNEYEMALESFKTNGRFASFKQEERLNMLLEASQMIKDMKNNQMLSNGNSLYQQINQIINIVISKHYSKLKNDIDNAKNIGIAAAVAVSPATVGAIYGISSLYKRETVETDYKQLEDIQGVNQILNEEDSGRGRR